MGTSTTYPNGQVLVSSALTVQQMNVLLQALTCGMIGINPPDFSQVRVDWPTQGQPFVTSPATDGCFLACATLDEEYSRVRDKQLVQTGSGPTTVLKEQWNYTRGWRISWVLYGPSAADRARQIHSAAIFMDYFSDQLSLSNLYPVSDPPNPTYVPEEFNAQWWPRADFHIEMYEEVTETIQDGVAKSVEIKVQDPVGLRADFTVSTEE